MKHCLLQEQFRDRLQNFISTNIRADIPGIIGDAILSVQKDNAVAFSRPIDPCEPGYEHKHQEAETWMARTLQIHQCRQGCMKLVNGRWHCKRWTPFPLAEQAWVDEDGTWGPKRLYGYFNNFCPPCYNAYEQIMTSNWLQMEQRRNISGGILPIMWPKNKNNPQTLPHF